MNAADDEEIVNAPNFHSASIEEISMFIHTCRSLEPPLCNYGNIATSLGTNRRNLTRWRVANDFADETEISEDYLLNEDNAEDVKARMDELRRHHFTFTDISHVFGVSVDKINRWKKSFSYDDPMNMPTTDEQLDHFVQNIQIDHPGIGEIMTWSMLEADGIFIRRERLRLSLYRTDGAERIKREGEEN